MVKFIQILLFIIIYVNCNSQVLFFEFKTNIGVGQFYKFSNTEILDYNGYNFYFNDSNDVFLSGTTAIGPEANIKIEIGRFTASLGIGLIGTQKTKIKMEYTHISNPTERMTGQLKLYESNFYVPIDITYRILDRTKAPFILTGVNFIPINKSDNYFLSDTSGYNFNLSEVNYPQLFKNELSYFSIKYGLGYQFRWFSLYARANQRLINRKSILLSSNISFQLGLIMSISINRYENEKRFIDLK